MGAKVIKGAWLLQEDGLKKDYGIRIVGNRIDQVAPNADLKIEAGDEVVEVLDQIIAPGFVNGHNHMYGFLSHGITAEALVTDFASFLDDFWWPYVENRIDHKLAEITTKMACVEMIDSGVTSFVDILEGPNSIPGALDVEAKVVNAAGLRGRLSFEACQRMSEENAQLGLKENIDFFNKTKGDDNLVQGVVSIHTLFTCDKDFVKQAKKEANEAGALIHMHMSESPVEPAWTQEHYGKTPTEVYDELGYLDENVLASQCVQINDDEIDILAARGVKVVSMPLSNCEVGGGFAPISKMLAKGMTVGLGSDGYINNFFEVMRGAFLMHKANELSTQTMPANLVYKMATSLGADACRIDAGRLAEGKLADVITIDMNMPTPVNEHNVYDLIVLFENPEHVCNVMCNGEWLKRDYQLTTLDKEEIKAELREVAAKFWRGE